MPIEYAKPEDPAEYSTNDSIRMAAKYAEEVKEFYSTGQIRVRDTGPMKPTGPKRGFAH